MFIFILKVFETLLTTTLNISEDNNTNTTSAAGDQSLHIQFIEAHAKQIIEPTFRAKRYLHGPDEIIIKTTNDVAMNVLKDNEIATLGPADPAAPRSELVLPGM